MTRAAVWLALVTLPALAACLNADAPDGDTAARDALTDDQGADGGDTGARADVAPADGCGRIPIGGADPSERPCQVCGPSGTFIPCPFACGDAGRCLAPVELALGARHTCARLDDGSVWCWGARDEGQLGADVAGSPSPVPARVPGLPPAEAISGRRHHTCALADGDAWCWGRNRFRQSAPLGGGSPIAPPALAFEGASGVGAGDETSCAIDGDGAVRCWGIAIDGQDWVNDRVGHYIATPTAVMGLGTVRRVAVGRRSACAWERSGAIACWGTGERGQLGDGAASDSAIPVPAALPDSLLPARLALGRDHALALGAQGDALVVWGDNADGQVTGDASRPHFATPEPIPMSVRGTMVGVAAGDAHSCLRFASGAVTCWGALGPVAEPEGSRAPVDVRGLDDATAIAAGAGHTCAITAAGWIRCWGDNGSGQLGRDPATTPEARVPVTIGVDVP